MEETSHKTIIIEGYQRSDMNNASHQILQTYVGFESFKIHDMNVKADIAHSIWDTLHNKQLTYQIGSVTKQPNSLVLTIETISQFNKIMQNLLDLLPHDYKRTSSHTRNVEIDLVKDFSCGDLLAFTTSS